jgi:dihydropteroate synthase
MNVIKANDKLLDLSIPQVMGIVNVTPDSFHRGSRIESTDQGLSVIAQMIEDGASIIDLGGQSSRPRAPRITDSEELKRMLPMVSLARKEFPAIILSIDTFYASVAKALIEEGVDMINDISAGSIDPDIFEVVGNSNVAYVLMHMLGTPTVMQDNPTYENVVLDILNFLTEKVDRCMQHGIHDIIIDPGFGFGKTVDQNYEILKKLSVFSILEKPILAGLSRKSMIYKTLDCDSLQALNGTTALHMIALQHGAKILRVHDVKEAKETITLHQKVL